MKIDVAAAILAILLAFTAFKSPAAACEAEDGLPGLAKPLAPRQPVLRNPDLESRLAILNPVFIGVVTSVSRGGMHATLIVVSSTAGGPRPGSIEALHQRHTEGCDIGNRPNLLRLQVGQTWLIAGYEDDMEWFRIRTSDGSETLRGKEARPILAKIDSSAPLNILPIPTSVVSQHQEAKQAYAQDLAEYKKALRIWQETVRQCRIKHCPIQSDGLKIETSDLDRLIQEEAIPAKDE